jgi:hypothetical protein
MAGSASVGNETCSSGFVGTDTIYPTLKAAYAVALEHNATNPTSDRLTHAPVASEACAAASHEPRPAAIRESEASTNNTRGSSSAGMPGD